MKIVLITTTIRVPQVLEQYRSIGPDVEFIIVGDRKTPHESVRQLTQKLGNATYYSDDDQEKMGYYCSEIIGWNKIMRRNIAILEAIRRKPDIIISIDDDNIPINANYFSDFGDSFGQMYNGLVAVSELKWFNAGAFLDPPVYHRGFPCELRNIDLSVRVEPRCQLKVGVCAGLWLGDPDIDTVERIVNKPLIRSVSEIIRNGIVVDNTCFTPFDSQNTAYLRELAPLMMLPVGIGRYDDIWASYISQRIMREEGYHVKFGKPLVWQERNFQSMYRNLEDEIFGMKYTSRFCKDLIAADLGRGKVLEKLSKLYEYLAALDYVPAVVHELGEAWCKDVEMVT